MTTWFSASAVIPQLRQEWYLSNSTAAWLTIAVQLGLVALPVDDGPYRFPPAVFDPHQIRRVFANRGVRLASLGYFGHMWELYAMWAWFLVFFRAAHGPGLGAAYATFAAIGIGAIGCY